MSALGLSALFRELKRRKVFRVGVVYAGVGFVVAQAADIAFPALQLPDWSVTLVVVLVLLGFPISLVLAWAFEITPDGVVRTEAVQGSNPGDTATALSSAGAPVQQFPRRFLPRTLSLTGAAVLLLAWGGFVLLGRPSPEEQGPTSLAAALPDRSIAVIPFTDLSPGRDQDWFSDGLTEDIQIHLAHLGDLKVIGHTSVMRYKGRDVGARQIGMELDVAFILAGSVRRAADRVLVNVHLISTNTDEQLWGAQYDRELTAQDLFRIQNEIARQIAHTLQARFSREQQVRMAQLPTENLEAYDLFLRAREHAQRLTRTDLELAREHFHRAIGLDSAFALAYAGLSWAASAMDGYHHLGAHWLDSASVAALKAVEMDPSGADGMVALALAQWNGGRLHDGVATYLRALAIRPNDADAFWGLAFIHWLLGDPLRTVGLARRAVELDPGHPGNVTLLGRGYASLGDTARAMESLRKALALQIDFPWAHQDLLWVLISQDRWDEAERHLRDIATIPALAREYEQNVFLLALFRGEWTEAVSRYRRGHAEVVGGIVMNADAALALERTGDTSQARELQRRTLERWEETAADGGGSYWPQVELGRMAAAVGDTAAALRWLEQASAQGWLAYPVIDLARDPVLRPYAGLPRFDALRRRILERVAELRAEMDQLDGAATAGLPAPPTALP